MSNMVKINKTSKKKKSYTSHLHSLYILQHINTDFPFFFLLHKTQQHCPLSVPVFDVESLGPRFGPYWSHGNLLLDVNGNWIKPVTGDAEKNPRCCITNELSTEVFSLLWEAATGNCCYLSVEMLRKNGCQMSKLPAAQRVLVTQKILKNLNKKEPHQVKNLTIWASPGE